ncbi:MAG: GIY-YIG nuclease family protein, partial [Lachnospiraceae bacterium]|nr:GIY-YIG nuclease family protein [Lachnospiraceae bacterium]
EQSHYQTAYERIQRQLQNDPNNKDLLQKKAELEEHLSDIDTALNDIDYRQANMKAGYVYVISNIGAFGKDVYKIGMTRRLDPQDRIDELGNASVPFNFDVHAMIFSDDAPALEAALHRAFEDQKLNMVNHRREFFHVSLDEIKKVIKDNFDKTVEFIDVPDAEQYRISLRMRSGDIPAEPQNTFSQELPPTTQTSVHIDESTELLYTKWGTYIMPSPYKINLKKGKRNDLQQIP